MSIKNEAYDFRVLRENEQQQEKVVKIKEKIAKRRKERALEHKKFVINLISTSCIFTIGVFGLIFGQARLTEATAEVERATKELEQCKSLKTQLSLQLVSQDISKSDKSRNDQKLEIVHISRKQCGE